MTNIVLYSHNILLQEKDACKTGFTVNLEYESNDDKTFF